MDDDHRGAGRGRRLDALDGVRGLSAIAVLVFHAYLFTPGDLGGIAEDLFAPFKMGVVVFFAVSGFLLYRPFAAATLRGAPRPSVRRFAANRVLRIVPAYWVVLLVCSALGTTVIAIHGANSMLGRLSATELLLHASLVSSFAPSQVLTGLTPAWTLAIETSFYMVLPLLGTIACHFARRTANEANRRRLAVAPALGLLACGILGQLAIHPGRVGDWDSASWSGVLGRSIVYNACLFTGGMLVAVLHVRQTQGFRRPRGLGPARRAAAIAALPVIFIGRPYLPWWLYIDAISVLASLLILELAFAGRRARITRALTSRTARGFGAISYGIYLWNYPVMLFLASHQLLTPGVPGVFRNIALACVVTVPAAAATHVLVERPFLALKGRSRPVAPGAHPALRATPAPPAPAERTAA